MPVYTAASRACALKPQFLGLSAINELSDKSLVDEMRGLFLSQIESGDMCRFVESTFDLCFGTPTQCYRELRTSDTDQYVRFIVQRYLSNRVENPITLMKKAPKWLTSYFMITLSS